MYKISGWLKSNQHLVLEENPMDEFLI
jgi:hypothetical protein